MQFDSFNYFFDQKDLSLIWLQFEYNVIVSHIVLFFFFFHGDLHCSLTNVNAITTETPLLKCKYLPKVHLALTVQEESYLCFRNYRYFL